VSDDPSTIKDLLISTGQQHGWMIALATTTWAVVLRFFIGHLLRERRVLAARLVKIEGLLINQGKRIANIEARSQRRRRGDPPDPPRFDSPPPESDDEFGT
jgi:hypothetical protein